ncbi:integumentary mucin C.1 [Oreochromis niloticus]|uniref:integumentary mucin C.1 n=1 Tax=Oreochromis niloticus TaxID=8128 RepID=UPI0009049814|nr:integumentary mucin C.1 [Oreochromis niloticus]
MEGRLMKLLIFGVFIFCVQIGQQGDTSTAAAIITIKTTTDTSTAPAMTTTTTPAITDTRTALVMTTTTTPATTDTSTAIAMTTTTTPAITDTRTAIAMTTTTTPAITDTRTAIAMTTTTTTSTASAITTTTIPPHNNGLFLIGVQKRTVVRLRMKRSADLTDPNIRDQVLQQLEASLQSQLSGVVSLCWRHISCEKQQKEADTCVENSDLL